MDLNSAIQTRIGQLCNQHQISFNKLAELSGRSPSTLKNILYGKSKYPRVDTIKAICDGVGISIAEFFSSELFMFLDEEG